ncbi:MAG: phosphatase PAP2 family protein [Verrucomicrobiae bacterium]|nr:phosphatase PAP2 family protein [Verrucomicrobiae bacterium]
MNDGTAEFSPSVAQAVARPISWPYKLGAVLPHEWVFGTFLLLTGIRLFLHGGEAWAWSFVFFGSWLAGLMVFYWAEKSHTPGRWRVRLLYYPVAMGVSFYAIGMAVPLLGIPKVDWLLLQWDRALFGETPSVAWESWLRPWAEDLSMAGYLFFFYYLIAGPGYYCLHNLRLFRKCIVGLFTLYGLAFMCYTVMPAGGPHRWMTFHTSLHGPWLLDWTLKPVNLGSNCVDTFPSVHMAASLYLLIFDWQHRRRRFWWVLAPCLVLWFSITYLRFHYFVDEFVGVVLALACWWLAEAYQASTSGPPRSPGIPAPNSPVRPTEVLEWDQKPR